MFKFNLYSLFGVNEKKINQSIISLRDQKRNLCQIIDDAVRSALIKTFPNTRYEERISTYGDNLNIIKVSLYKKYSNLIDLRINTLNSLREEIRN